MHVQPPLGHLARPLGPLRLHFTFQQSFLLQSLHHLRRRHRHELVRQDLGVVRHLLRDAVEAPERLPTELIGIFVNIGALTFASFILRLRLDSEARHRSIVDRQTDRWQRR